MRVVLKCIGKSLINYKYLQQSGRESSALRAGKIKSKKVRHEKLNSGGDFRKTIVSINILWELA